MVTPIYNHTFLSSFVNDFDCVIIIPTCVFLVYSFFVKYVELFSECVGIVGTPRCRGFIECILGTIISNFFQAKLETKDTTYFMYFFFKVSIGI